MQANQEAASGLRVIKRADKNLPPPQALVASWEGHIQPLEIVTFP